MPKSISPTKVAQTFWPVKSPIFNNSSPDPGSMIHHNVSISTHKKITISYNTLNWKPYGVSPARRVLSPQALLKRFDVVKDGLITRIGLTPKQADVTMELLRLWCYYGYVYPKASQVIGEPEISPELASWRAEIGIRPDPRPSVCSRATFWRTIKLLEGLGLVEIINRYVKREHAQISNLYRLDQLVLALVRYIAERREFLFPSWLEGLLSIPARAFWSFLSRQPGDRAGPAIPSLEGVLLSRAQAIYLFLPLPLCLALYSLTREKRLADRLPGQMR